VGTNEIQLDVVIVADWMSLQGVLGDEWCFYCPCSEDTKHLHHNPTTRKPWALTNGEQSPNQALWPILRKNIFLCYFHDDKRITEKTKEQQQEKYNSRLFPFVKWLQELGGHYKIDISTEGPPPIKLNGP